jgi:hypothetical protein
MTPRDALVALTAMLAPDWPDVTELVLAAHDNPASYTRRPAPVPLLPWVALVDALADHDLLAEVDRRERPDEVVRMLRRLATSPPDVWDWPTEADRHLRTGVFLERVAQHLREAGVTLSALDIRSDCYPLVLTPVARTTELNGLAELAGHRVRQFTTYT